MQTLSLSRNCARAFAWGRLFDYIVDRPVIEGLNIGSEEVDAFLKLKMKSFFLCIFALCALPNGLAISCYRCIAKDDLSQNCTNNLRCINCDTSPDKHPDEKMDACLRVSYQYTIGNEKILQNTMKCVEKANCKNVNDFCNVPGKNLTACNATCCYQDKCNGLNAGLDDTCGSFFSTMPATTSGIPTSIGCLHVASFMVIFMSFTVIFAVFFMH